ncbi:MAG: DUF4331 domain-containing protein [Phycisphaerales bacterium]
MTFKSRSFAAAALVALAGLAPMSQPALASSHREAPAIASMPQLDSTDFYMFNSYEPGRSDYVTIVANYIPFQTPYGGPNFFQMDSEALYQVHVDNDGDAKEDITFSFRFTNNLRNLSLNIGGVQVPVALYNINTIGPLAGQNANLNITETYTVDVTYGDQYHGYSVPLRTTTNKRNIPKPADFVGGKTYPNNNYECYAQDHIVELNLPGCSQNARAFVGQRKDPFVVNLGETFDLINTNPLQAPNAKRDSLEDDNCTSIIIEVPKSFLKGCNDTIIGGWTSASLPQTRVLRNNPTFNQPSTEVGQWVQMSRLSMPLVNELVIGIKDKNKFGNSRPRNDAQFATYVTNPTLPAIIDALFGVPAPCLPRNDLVSVFLTGLDGLNKPVGVRPAEMMRLNMNVNPTQGGIAITPVGSQSPLGALGGDLQGYPNGRRPGDDVVDISLRVVVGALIPNAGQPGSCAPGGNLPLTDGAFVNDANYFPTFPYLKTPISSSPQQP